MSDYRDRLVNLLGRLDQQLAAAEDLASDPVDSDNLPMIEELRELLVDIKAKVEAKLDAGTMLDKG